MKIQFFEKISVLKNLARVAGPERFCSGFRTNSILPEIRSKHQQLSCSFALMKNLDRYLGKSSRIYFPLPSSLFFAIRRFLALSHDQSFSSFRWKNCLPFNIDWLVNFWRWATLIGSFEFKGNAQFVKDTTFGLWEKMIAQTRRMFCKIPMNALVIVSVILHS